MAKFMATTCLIILSIIGNILFINTVAAQSAQQQIPCYERAEVVKKLNTKYKEHQVAIGLNKDGTKMMELYASVDGSWTLILTNTDKTSCLVMAGDSFNIIKDIKELEGI